MLCTVNFELKTHQLKELVGDYWPGVHLFPSRTEKLSPEPPMILGSNLVK